MKKLVVAGLVAGSIALATVAFAQTTQLAPTATATTFSAAAQIIGQNPGRKDFRICNVSSNVVWIWPGPLSPAVSAYELPALSSGTTVCFTPPDGAVGSGASGQGNSWNAAPAASVPATVSVFEW